MSRKTIALLTWIPVCLGVVLAVQSVQTVRSIGLIIWLLGVVLQFIVGIVYINNRLGPSAKARPNGSLPVALDE